MELVLSYIIIFFIGLFFGSFFCKLAFRIPKKRSISDNSYCYNCNSKLSIIEKIPFFSYIFQLGKCKHCKAKIPYLYPIFEILTGILFVICFHAFKDDYPSNLNIIFALLFTSSCILIIISDIKYMVIPNEILIFFLIVLIPLKLEIIYKLNPGYSFVQMGYELLFILIDGAIMFVFMVLIKLFGDFLLKKDSMGGGDIKMMSYVSIILGWKLSIFAIFISSFLALPISAINMYKNKDNMIPFGPYLAISSLILFLSKIDYNMIMDFIF